MTENRVVAAWLADFEAGHARDFSRALREIEAGKKRTDWMWFVFPQVSGLGRTPTSVRFAVPSIEHGRAFLTHPVLGSNFLHIVKAARRHLEAGVGTGRVRSLFGQPDDRKFVSSITLMGGLGQREGLTDVANECAACLELAFADGMSGCRTTIDFLKEN